MKEIFPVGTVAELSGHGLLLAGFQELEEEGRYRGYYFCVPYPQGYVGREQLYLVPGEAFARGGPGRVLSLGYRGPKAARYWEGVAGYLEGIQGLTPQEVSLTRRLIRDMAAIRRKAAQEEAEKMEAGEKAFAAEEAAAARGTADFAGTAGRRLPLGTAVRLKDGAQAVLIGYLPVNAKGKSDYLGVPYPVGMRSAGNMRCFDEREICQVLKEGALLGKAREFLANLAAFEGEIARTGIFDGSMGEEK